MNRSNGKKISDYFDEIVGDGVRGISIALLRISLGTVFFWFGVVKVFGQSPAALMIEKTYWFLPMPETVICLGVVEVIIGLALMLKIFVRVNITMLWIHMAGVFSGIVLNPNIYFKIMPLEPSLYGEFVIKNLVIAAASLVIVSYKASQRDPS